jgi:hypothetical protein
VGVKSPPEADRLASPQNGSCAGLLMRDSVDEIAACGGGGKTRPVERRNAGLEKVDNSLPASWDDVLFFRKVGKRAGLLMADARPWLGRQERETGEMTIGANLLKTNRRAKAAK